MNDNFVLSVDWALENKYKRLKKMDVKQRKRDSIESLLVEYIGFEPITS